MIERIFIPTVHRVNNQITYNNLPDRYKEMVTFVVQAWERPQYEYNCNYLILPDTSEYHFSDYYCLPKTRKLIYEAGKNMKYCVFDDDLKFARRNAKYFGQSSNMEKSRRWCTDDDYDEMFYTFNKWLDEVTVVGCSQIENPPSGSLRRDNTSITSAYWINGSHFTDILHDLDLTNVRVGEDACFLLSLLSRGYANRVSDEFVMYNTSNNNKKMKSTVWDEQKIEQTLRDHQYLEKLFPDVYTILYDEDGNRSEGGYRNSGRSKIEWSKAYKNFQKKSSSLESFFE
jgi:hypothetical protein